MLPPNPPRFGTLKLDREICCMPRCCCSNGTRATLVDGPRPAKFWVLICRKFPEAERSVIRKLVRSGETGSTPRTIPAF
jgi:hypothetical protein